MTGTITGFETQGGIATVFIDDTPYHGDNGPTCRALGSMFECTHDMNIFPDEFIGEEICFEADGMVLVSIGPLDDNI